MWLWVYVHEKDVAMLRYDDVLLVADLSPE